MIKLISFLLSLVCILCLSTAFADPKEEIKTILEKVDEAVKIMNDKKDASIPEFQKDAKWNWGTNYIYVIDCDKMITLAHPMVPALVGKSTKEMKDNKGNFFFQKFCEIAKTQEKGGWIEYWWPKPGTKEPIRKISFTKCATKNFSFCAGAGVYDEKNELKVDELNK
ncbi:MAG: cache domain-containing protein [Oligoflexia bacterium]|nr:cache domain-containing protein [Oligoflexia bacterium]